MRLRTLLALALSLALMASPLLALSQAPPSASTPSVAPPAPSPPLAVSHPLQVSLPAAPSSAPPTARVAGPAVPKGRGGPITATATFTTTFDESGLPSGTEWYAWIYNTDGDSATCPGIGPIPTGWTNETSTTTSIAFTSTIDEGYQWCLYPVDGYTPSSSSVFATPGIYDETFSTTLPAAPTNLAATPAETSAALTWTNPTGPGTITGDEVAGAHWDASTGACGTYPTPTAIGVATSYTAPGLSPGTEYCAEVAAENAGGYGAFATITFTTLAGPTATISASKNPTDAGVSVTFTASVSGGTSPYSYAWTVSGTTQSSTTSTMSYTFPDSGNYDVNLSVKDADGIYSNVTLSEGVDPALVASASSNLTTADAGYSIAFTGSATGGDNEYTYAWVLSGNTISTAASFDYSFSAAGSYTVDFTVTDSIGFADTASVSVTINADPTVTVASNANPADEGYAVTFTATGSGGTGTLTYAWTVGGTAEGTGATLSYTFSTSGSYTVTATVTDGEKQTGSGTVTETVEANPTVSISISPNPTDIGVAATFTASPSGGVSPYSYAWTVNGAAISGTTASTTYTPSSSGTFTVAVTLTDADGHTATASDDLSVNGDVSAAVSSGQNPTDVGNTVTYTASASGGTSPYTYAWKEGSTAECGTTSTCALDMSSSGSVTITVTVTDSAGDTYTTSLTETVNADPTVTISSSQNPTDVGESPTFTATASNGVSPYTYAWTINGATQSSTTSSMSYTFPSSGSYTVEVKVTDSVSVSTTYSLTETVNADPSVTVSPNANPTDAGVAVTFTATATGGTSPYSYAWTVNSVAQSSTSSTLSWTPSASGTYTIEVTVTDGVGKTASATVDETVIADPSVTFSAQYNPVDRGVADVFTPTVTGGTGPYTYSWTVGGTVEGTGSTLSYAFASTGSYTVNLTLTDTFGKTATASLTVTVQSDPAVTASGPSAWDEGIGASWTSTVSYGATPYTYSWTVNGASVGTAASLSYTFSAAGSYVLNLTVTDSQGVKGYYQETETVNAQPSVSASASASAADVGSSVTFTATITAGTAPYTYVWTADGSQVGTASTLTWSVADTGTNDVEVEITDAAGAKATSSEVLVTGNALPSVSLSAAHSPTDPGVLDTITSVVTAGTSPYAYAWTIDGTTQSSTASALSWTPSSAGTYTINVTVTDTDGNTARASISVTVNPAPTVTESASPSTGSVGVSTTYTATVSGGVGPFTYSWTNDSTSIGTSNPLSYTIKVAGTFYINVTVTDSLGLTATASLQYTVNNAPVATITESATATDVGLSISFGSSVSGGTPPYTYAWTVGGVSEGTGSTMDYRFANTGTYTVELVVTDAHGLTSSPTVTITVNPSLTASVSAAYVEIDTGVSDTFTAAPTDGTTPYSYVWAISPGGTQSGTSQSETFTFSSPGTYEVNVTVTDAAGESATAKVSVTVVARPTATIAAQYNPVDVGVSDEFSPSVSGGVGPYAYSWLEGGVVTNTTHLTLNFSAAGSYTVQLTVTDSFGIQSTVSLSVTVEADPVVTAELVNPPVVVSLNSEYHATATGGYGAYTFKWSFPGGVQTSGPYANYTWESSGPIDYQLAFSDQGGYAETLDLTGYAHLYVLATANVTEGPSPLLVSFSASVLGGSSYVYNWTLGNGHSSVSADTQATYYAGNYTAELVVTSANGAKGWDNVTITSLPGVPPVIVVTGVETPIVTQTVLSVSAAKSTDSDATILYYNWTLGASTFRGATQNLWFNATGTFTLGITITDSRGASASESFSIVVTLPTSNTTSIHLVVSEAKAPAGDLYTLSVASSGGITAADAFLGGTVLSLSQLNTTTYAGGVAYANYTLTLDPASFSLGDYVVSFTVWNNASQTNTVSAAFVVAASSGGPGFNLVNAVGGEANFWFIVTGIIGTIATIYGVTRRNTVDVDVAGVQLQGRKGKPLTVVSTGTPKGKGGKR